MAKTAKKGRLVAGTASTIAHMAKLRAMRVKGGSIQSLARKIKKGVTKASHVAGYVAQQAKKVIPQKMVQDIASKAVSAASTAIGRPDLGAKAQQAISSGISAAYNTNLAKGSVGKNLVRNYKAEGGPVSIADLQGGAMSGMDHISGKFLKDPANTRGVRLPSGISRLKGRGFLPAGVGNR